MRIVIVGPGRAGSSVGIAAASAGQDVVAVVGRDPAPTGEVARAVDATPLPFDVPLPPADLVIVAVRDDAIGEVAARLVDSAAGVDAAVHLSGATSTERLAPLARAGLLTGSFHPLQSLPGGEVGARRIPGSWFAITAAPPLADDLRSLARSMGGRPFLLADDRKVLYHAAATMAANVPLAGLAVARRLFEAAGVPFEAARPLVEGTVANAFDLGPRRALTGPVARGDVGTVEAHLAAVAEAAPDDVEQFRRLTRAVARLAGADEVEDLLR